MMGRRALRQPDPLLDLSRYLHSLESLPRPLDPTRLFGREAPLEVEVGSGKGLFLAGASRALPDRHFLGCELAGKYARFSAARLARWGVSNAVVVQGDAWRLFRECLLDGAAVAVHVYFPDPWWKKRHKKRRVMNEAFLGDIQRVLTPGGRLHFWTDVREYFDATLDLIARVPGFEGPLVVPASPASHDMDYRTHFERRMRLRELEVFRAEFLRR